MGILTKYVILTKITNMRNSFRDLFFIDSKNNNPLDNDAAIIIK